MRIFTASYVEVTAIIGQDAKIPCDLTPHSRQDEAYLVLWYKDIFGTPIYRYTPGEVVSKTKMHTKSLAFYSFDMRDQPKHWVSSDELDERAIFHVEKTDSSNPSPTSVDKLNAYLSIKNVSDKKSQTASKCCKN